MKTMVLLAIVSGFNFMYSQRLHGKWLETKDGNTYTIPEIGILEFDGDSINRFNFENPVFVAAYDLRNNELIVEGKTWGKIPFINDDRFKLFHMGDTRGAN